MQLNSLLPPCQKVERGSKVSKVKKYGDGTVQCPMCPHKERGRGRTHPATSLFPPPGLAGTREAGSVLHISEDKLVREVRCPSLIKAKIRSVFIKTYAVVIGQ